MKIYPEYYQAFLGEEKLDLTLKEFQLLLQLVANPGKVYTRDYLLENIWGYEFVGDTRTVDVHIRNVRKKLGNSPGSSVN